MNSVMRRTLPRTGHGAGLPELMIAITIGMVLIAGALTVFVNSNQTYDVNQSVARLQENARYALDELAYELQLAGYWGRNSTTHLILGRKGASSQLGALAGSNDCADRWYIDLDRRVEGLNNTNSPYHTTCIPAAQYQAGTDVLVIRHVETTPVAALAASTTYIRADQHSGQIFTGTTEPSGFSATAENYRLASMAYYVSGFTNSAGDGIPALKRAALGVGPAVATGEVVIDGVENMQVQYGLDSDANASVNRYVNAGNVAANQWDDIRAVRIWLLMRAQRTERNYTNSNTYGLPEGNFTPNDGFRRLLVSRTVQLRN